MSVQTPETVAAASEAALTQLLDMCAPAFQGKTSGTKAMDMGAAYGGCARSMAKRFGCQVSLCRVAWAVSDGYPKVVMRNAQG